MWGLSREGSLSGSAQDVFVLDKQKSKINPLTGTRWGWRHRFHCLNIVLCTIGATFLCILEILKHVEGHTRNTGHQVVAFCIAILQAINGYYILFNILKTIYMYIQNTKNLILKIKYTVYILNIRNRLKLILVGLEPVIKRDDIIMMLFKGMPWWYSDKGVQFFYCDTVSIKLILILELSIMCCFRVIQ